MLKPFAPASTVATVLNPGPPRNCDGRETVIVAASVAVSQPVIGGGQNATTRPVIRTADSSARSPIQPASGSTNCCSSSGTRSRRALGGATTAANASLGGLPQHTF